MNRKRQKAAAGRARDRPQAARTDAQTGRGAQGLTLTRPSAYRRAAADMAGSEVIYSAVTRIANAIATMPIHLYRGTQKQADDPRELLLSLRPNRRQSAFQFKQAMEIYRNTEGRAYAVKRFDDGYRLSAIEVLDPARVTPLEDADTGEMWYAVTREDGTVEYLHNWYVLSLFHASTNGVSGVRVVDVLRGSLDYNAEIKAFSLANLKAVNRGIVLEFPTTIAGPRREKAMKEFIDLYRKSGGQVIALDAGIKASCLTMSPIESGVFDVEKVTRSRVAMVYNMSPSQLGDTSSVKRATTEDDTIEFLTITAQPIVQQWEDELNYKLLTAEERRSGLEFRVDVEAYLRSSPVTRANVAQSRVRCGLRTLNEIRAADYMPPVEGGDCPMISKDLAPVAMVAKGATVDIDALHGEQNAAKGTKNP